MKYILMMTGQDGAPITGGEPRASLQDRGPAAGLELLRTLDTIVA